jgi:hypothetical protein
MLRIVTLDRGQNFDLLFNTEVHDLRREFVDLQKAGISFEEIKLGESSTIGIEPQLGNMSIFT